MEGVSLHLVAKGGEAPLRTLFPSSGIRSEALLFLLRVPSSFLSSMRASLILPLTGSRAGGEISRLPRSLWVLGQENRRHRPADLWC